ncbi:MAG: RluA family pseudouridine synthase, partial [Candidatus Tectomicrobia bacterium]|nr:RluA family pseudouridine synthase [Candidatus Tectomicrobia bacterium]
ERPGIVHRLDKDTSGLLMVAKNDLAHSSLTRQLQSRTVKRFYVTLCLGVIEKDSGRINAPIGRHMVDRKKMSTVTNRGREAVTEFRVLERFAGASLLEMKLGTGRTHQIRVHLASLRHPVLGDKQYGGTRKTGLDKKTLEALDILGRQALHAQVLGFVHPDNGRYLEFVSSLPQDMQDALNILRQ